MSDTEKTDVDRKRILTITLKFLTSTVWDSTLEFSSSTNAKALDTKVVADLYTPVLEKSKLNAAGGQNYITDENGYTISFTKSAEQADKKFYAETNLNIQYKIKIPAGDSVTTKLFSQVLDTKLSDTIKTQVTANAQSVSFAEL